MSPAFHAGKGATLSVKGLQGYGCFCLCFCFFKSLIIALKRQKAVSEAIKDLKEWNIAFPSYITKTNYI